MAPYPSKSEIEQFARSLETTDSSPFFDRVSPAVQWTVMGDHPAAGHFTSLGKRIEDIKLGGGPKLTDDTDAWRNESVAVISTFLSEFPKLQVVNVVGGGDQEWAFLELATDAVCKNGMPYPQRYAWAMRFDETGCIVQVKAYLDSALLERCYYANNQK